MITGTDKSLVANKTIIFVVYKKLITQSGFEFLIAWRNNLTRLKFFNNASNQESDSPEIFKELNRTVAERG